VEAFLIGVGQVALSLVISGVIAMLIGTTYIAVAALVVATCWALLFVYATEASEVAEQPVDLRDLLSISATSLVFGLIWPALPLILTWKRGGERAADGSE
jgi:hypothetical protein